jgi:putative nucleotidyltransferase with HDIG domain
MTWFFQTSVLVPLLFLTSFATVAAEKDLVAKGKLLVTENCEQVLNNLTDYFGDWAEEVLCNLAGNNRLPLLKLTALLHDIGKPLTAGMNTITGKTTFYGHARAGARLAGLSRQD